CGRAGPSTTTASACCGSSARGTATSCRKSNAQQTTQAKATAKYRVRSHRVGDAALSILDTYCNSDLQHTPPTRVVAITLTAQEGLSLLEWVATTRSRAAR